MMTAITETPILLFNESRKRGLLLLCVFLFPLFFTSILFGIITFVGDIDLKLIGNKTEFAQIELPKNRSIVNKKFEISGSLKAPLPEHSYYLVEYRNKHYWPKFDLGTKAKTWNKNLTHRGKKNSFVTYQVVMADPAVKKILDDWFTRSRDTGKYPGIANLTFEHLVAKIKVKTQ